MKRGTLIALVIAVSLLIFWMRAAWSFRVVRSETLSLGPGQSYRFQVPNAHTWKVAVRSAQPVQLNFLSGDTLICSEPQVVQIEATCNMPAGQSQTIVVADPRGVVGALGSIFSQRVQNTVSVQLAAR